MPAGSGATKQSVVRRISRVLLWGYCALPFLIGAASSAAESPRATRAAGPTAIGIEYVLLDRAARIPVEAAVFADTGLTAVKHYCEHVEWGVMQPRADAAIDFVRMDAYVRHYQAAGFDQLTLCLKSHSRWASRAYRGLRATDPSPRPEHEGTYAAWIGAVVERYDHDGVADMPGLRRAVDLIEIGSELSSYEPEPIARYLDTLAIAYRAAHDASSTVRVAHAAILHTPVFGRVPIERSVAGYRSAFAEVIARTNPHHGYADVAALLDRPDLFDVVNLHNLGDPYEIEAMVDWVNFEMQRRGWHKPVLISDTVATPFIAWGAATDCQGRPERLGVIIPPATERDRCRLAEFFTRLTRSDADALRWSRRFIAADSVRRAIIAAEQRVMMVNLAFNIDLPGLTWPIARAGAGLTAWAGAVEYQGNRVKERRPMYFALRQLMTMLENYRSVSRVSTGDDHMRMYRIERPRTTVWVAWVRPESLLLPGDGAATRMIQVPVDAASVQVHELALSASTPSPQIAQVVHGMVELEIGVDPVWLVSELP